MIEHCDYPMDVRERPLVILESWQILKILLAEDPRLIGHHYFAGRDYRSQRWVVSSHIDWFDPSNLRGITQTGRAFKLSGEPDLPSSDFDRYQWVKEVMYQDSTLEFFGMHGAALSIL